MTLMDVTPAVLYAFALGLVAAVNPCGFPLLPAYLALFLDTEHTSAHASGSAGPRRIVHALVSGLGMTAGFTAVFAVAAVAIGASLSLVSQWLPWVMIPIGLVMIGVGIAALLGRRIYLSLPSPSPRGRGRGAAATVLFGIAYATGSLSCAFPLFLGAVGGPIAHQDYVQGIASFLAYALGMGLLVTALAVTTALAGNGLSRVLRRASRVIPFVCGVVLIVAGASITAYWLAEVGVLPSGEGLTRIVSSVQSTATSFLAAHVSASALALTIVLAAGLAVVVRHEWRALRPRAPRTLPPRVLSADKGTTPHE